METGELTERIQIYAPKPNSNLTSLDDFEPFLKLWANVRQITTREQMRSGIDVQSGQMTVLTRFIKGLSDDCLIKWRDKFYAIDSLSPDSRKGEIILGCSYSGLNENQGITT